MAISWQTDVGVNHVGAYQVSGKPYVKKIATDVTTQVLFPNVSRWLYVRNEGSNPCRIAFSELGITNPEKNYLEIRGNTATPAFELKASEVWVSGSNSVYIVAGLTNIKPVRISGSVGPSWSGSAGVG